MPVFHIKVRNLKHLKQHIIIPPILHRNSHVYLQVCSLSIKLYAWTNHINSQDSARVCMRVCVWGSHCNCRLLVSVSNCSVKLAQAVASSMKLQMKFNLLHIHCLHRDHGQDTPRVVEGFNTCICALGKVIVCTIVSQFSEVLAKTPLFESLESVRFFG